MFFDDTEGMSGDVAPISLPGGPDAVLGMHGYSGTPYDLRPLAERLARDGFAVEVPLLSGHGGTVAELAETDRFDWYHDAVHRLHELRRRSGRPVSVAGFSMGGLLALKLAIEYPESIASLTLLAPALRLPSWQERGARLLLRRLPGSMTRSPRFSWPRLGGPDCGDDQARSSIPTMPAMPISGIGSMLDLRDEVVPRLAAIACPALVVHGVADRVIPFKASFDLIRRIGTPQAEYLWLQRSRHALLHDVDREAVIETVAGFCGRHRRR